MPKVKFTLLLLLTGILAGCSTGLQNTQTPLPQLSGTLRPFPSQTFTPEHPPTATPTRTATPIPTATPFYYTVDEKDDMFGIALRYGISLDALKTANPNINPYMMGVGTQLLIPITPTPMLATPTPQTTATTASATSTAVLSLQPDCYRDAAGGVICFVLAQNLSDKPIENPTALVTLEGLSTEYSLTQTSILPLNLLPAGAALPLVTYFQPPTPEKFTAMAEADFWLPVPERDARYLETILKDLQTEVSADGRSAEVYGQVALSDPTKQASSIWLLATAFTQDGHVAGIRRWEAPLPIPASQAIPFSFTVYSMGPEIARLEVSTEARTPLE
jgi:hypothetical protein